MIISVGGLIPRKRHLQLIRCFAKTLPDNPSIKLSIVGEGPERRRIEELIIQNKLEDRVVLKGSLPREEVARDMQGSDLFVLSSAAETFGVVYIEALSCGLPVIGARNGGADEIINKTNGILVNVDDDRQLTKALLDMYHRREDYDSERIAEEAKNRYSEEIVMNRLQTIYNKAIEGYKYSSECVM